MTKKTSIYISAAFNLAIFVMEVVALVMSINKNGVGCFQYYTVLSNVFALVAVGVLLAFEIVFLVSQKDIPSWALMLKYMAACCLCVTFVVVVTILCPMWKDNGGAAFLLFGDEMLYHHTLCPILTLVSFIFFEHGTFTKKSTFAALVPTLCYGVVTIALNLLRVMEGPYPFLYVYDQPWYMSVLWVVVIFGGAYLFAFLIRLANKAAAKLK